MTRIVWISILIAGASTSFAQQTPPSGEHTTTIQLQPKTPLNDKATLVSAIAGSYYHPDAMVGLDCEVAIDWPAFSNSLKTQFPPERMKIIQGLKIRSKAKRGKTAEIIFDWAGGTLNGGQDQMESGVKQMVGGFFQAYWNMAATTLIAKPSDVNKSEPIAGGGMKIYTGQQGSSLVMTVDGEYTPTHFVLDAPAMKASIDVKYLPSEHPVPGDLRRISQMDMIDEIGSSTINVGIGLDYQAVDAFNVPKNVTFGMTGAYSIKMEFSGCSAARETDTPEAK